MGMWDWADPNKNGLVKAFTETIPNAFTSIPGAITGNLDPTAALTALGNKIKGDVESLLQMTGASASETTRTMLASSLDLAGRLGLSAVAEGVETQQDWALLKRMGCDYAQGYFMARPQSAAELPAAIARWTAAHRALTATAAAA